MRRFAALFITLSALGFVFGGGLAPAEAAGGRHPYFNDRGTLRWFRSYAEAKRVAKARGKLIFIESGRTRCSMCRKLATKVLPNRSIAPRLSKIAIGLAAEADHPERAVQQLFRTHLPNPQMLPLVGFVTPDGQWVTGFWGGRSVSQFARDLERAEAAWRRLQRRQGASPKRPGRQVTRAPEPVPAPAPRYAPDPIVVAHGDPDGPCEPEVECDSDSCCPDGECCVGGQCRPPGYDEVDFLDDCQPPVAPTVTAPDPVTAPEPVRAPDPIVVAEAEAGFPPPTTLPEPTLGEPTSRKLDSRRRQSSRGLPAPPAGTPHVALGDPDAENVAPMPVVVRRPVTRSPKDLTTVNPASTARAGAARRAEKAAARGQWGEVLRVTSGQGGDALVTLNRKAHAWAHDTLDQAVKDVERGRIDTARRKIQAVKREMDGQPVALDAARGLDAIEFVQDLHYLAADSLVRRAVRKNAYEKMRGSRWARLFR